MEKVRGRDREKDRERERGRGWIDKKIKLQSN